MNTAKGWRAGLALMALLALPGAGLADALCVESLCLAPSADWRRGPAQQEQADGVYQLDLPVGGKTDAQVLLMRGAPAVRGDAAAYYDRLTRFWRASYGKHVLIDWIDLGGMRWRYLRRPASADGQGVFQLATVFEGRAYSLLVFVPGTVTSLAGPVRELLAGIRFEPQAGKRDQGPAQGWARARTYRFNLSGEVLEAVVAPDAERMGEDGMLTGYGLDYGESSVSWFMEGFAWKTVDGRGTRVPWATRGRLEVEAPAESVDGTGWSLRLHLPEDEPGVSARLTAWDLCGPGQALQGALERLKLGARGPMERLAATRPAGCPPPVGADPGWRLEGVPGRTVELKGALPLPPADAGDAAPPGQARLLLVEAILEPMPGRTVPGESLLQRARLFFAYEPRPPRYLSSR